MDKELKAKWVAALRSGEYTQGTGTLYIEIDHAYCCYGVLRHVADPNDTRGGDCLTNRQLEEYGIDSFSFQRAKLENMNDGANSERKHSFAEIADYIEANL